MNPRRTQGNEPLSQVRPSCFGQSNGINARDLRTSSKEQTAVEMLKNPNFSGRRARWFMAAQDYGIDLKYVPGNANKVTDALSRHSTQENKREFSQKERAELINRTGCPIDAVNVIDDVLVWMCHECDPFDQLSGVLHKRIVPKSLRNKVFELMHDDDMRAHPGRDETNNGTEFNNSSVQEICDAFKVEKVTIQPYQPASDGLEERNNRKVLDELRHAVGQDPDWDVNLPLVQLSLNAKYHTSTQATPIKTLMGHESRLPYAWLNQPIQPNYSEDTMKIRVGNFKVIHKQLYKNLEEAQKNMIDKHQEGLKPVDCKTGNEVYIKKEVRSGINYKLAIKFTRPYKVIDVQETKDVYTYIDKVKQHVHNRQPELQEHTREIASGHAFEIHEISEGKACEHMVSIRCEKTPLTPLPSKESPRK
ncbi:uncharacterized protein [Macrobrachium rosenbergii]|uniref:uncharacterized protein n=1 Tax=Macrobrachium rosenbergii TaxID=79674 RepID=UPI0034D4E077